MLVSRAESFRGKDQQLQNFPGTTVYRKEGTLQSQSLDTKKRRTVHLLKINVTIVKKGLTSFTKRNPDQKGKNGNPFLFHPLGMDK
jgi:hypothetical protein